jgi:hypothetical protein
LTVFVIGAFTSAGHILRVFPDIIRAFTHAIVLEIEVALYACQAIILGCALEARRHAINAFLFVVAVRSQGTIYVTLVVVYVRVDALLAH